MTISQSIVINVYPNIIHPNTLVYEMYHIEPTPYELFWVITQVCLNVMARENKGYCKEFVGEA